ncbi:helix-turn-helix domain-containing protein [Ktedonobacter racemifer]|uniref:Helix-turn-helix domain protein n=1 Tax=Ktedonobacter racemifer DSM 44963 TaxID=485913 RepID=D6TKU9_KTERA|nr:helix-turn-helix transcriptional regulator [Ktedonobacter racemifer]EFH86399.1 helix-turn-helix domain protein [Ktedonobacter racemifer DSM 44963]
MQEFVQGDSNKFKSGEQLYLEWKHNLLSTPEARSAYEEVANEFDILLELVEARLDAGITQAAIAKRLKVPKSQIVQLEELGYRACTFDLLQQYAHVLGKKLQVSLV